jgi:hypothetical protein
VSLEVVKAVSVKMEAADSSESLVIMYQTTQYYITEDCAFHIIVLRT